MKRHWFWLIVFCVTAHAETSKDIRQTLKYETGIQYGIDYRMENTGGLIGKYLSSDEVLVFKMGEGSTGHRQQFDTALQYKRYLGNSFYVAPEIYYLNYQVANSPSWFDSGTKKLASMGVGVRIGNQWQLKRFTIGVDWFGIGKNVVYWNKGRAGRNEVTASTMNVLIGYSF